MGCLRGTKYHPHFPTLPPDTWENQGPEGGRYLLVSLSIAEA